VRLLVSGAQFFAALLEAIEGARRSVHMETYIFAGDATGAAVRAALLRAAARGVEVRLLVDGFGSAASAGDLAQAFAATPARLRVYRPQRWWRPWWRQLRRLHRKLAVIDERLAFVGGINVEDDPARDPRTGEDLGPRFDFAVACEGPLVAAVAATMRRLWWAVGAATYGARVEAVPRRPRPPAALAGGVRAALALRDNLRHRHSIERGYLAAIGGARREVLVACAYFLPGRRLRRALLRAARRGVRVRLLLQGRVEYRLQHVAQGALYGQLLAAGIEIHEYRAGYLHAKVAVIDEDWATVGSSNIDPFSLLLAREANVVVRDAAFAGCLRGAVEAAIAAGSTRLEAGTVHRTWSARLAGSLAVLLVRVATALLAGARDY
jgi:cardiolipin synthase